MASYMRRGDEMGEALPFLIGFLLGIAVTVGAVGSWKFWDRHFEEPRS